MNSKYGLEIDGRNVLYFFRPHGSKNWKDLIAGFINVHDQNGFLPFTKGAIVLHDQEPFDQNSLDTYKQEESIEKNEMWRQHQPNSEVLLVHNAFTIGWPILCHSDFNSIDIKFAEQSGMICCYYFYHGLISRDWFRHWKHHGWISPDKSWQHRFLLYARDLTGSRQYRSNLIQSLTPLKDIVNYNWDQKSIVPSDHSAKISETDAQSSAIHIVAETVFDQEKIHLTEKIFKPMVMMQPFILFAGAGSLQYLKNYGFKTFGDIWDESYDSIPNHSQRFAKIMDLITYLANLDRKVFCEKLQQAKDIVLHNHQRFFSTEFENQMLQELKTNMSECLKRQDIKTSKYPGGTALEILAKRLKRNINPVASVERLKSVLSYLHINDKDRYDAIFQSYDWLRHSLI